MTKELEELRIDNDYLKAVNEIQKNNIKMLIEENRTMKKSFQVLAIIKRGFKISAYHSRHTNTGYEMCIEDNDRNFVYEVITKEEFDLLKEGLGYYDENGIKRD